MVSQWSDVLPVPMDIRQTAWERRHRVKRTRGNATLIEMGEAMGVTGSRATQMCNKAYADDRRGIKSPLERYLDQTIFDDEMFIRSEGRLHSRYNRDQAARLLTALENINVLWR